MNKTLIIILLLFSPVVFSQGPNYHNMEGSFFIWGEHLPNSNTKDLKGISFFITGESAKRIYEKMKSKAVYNECYNNGTVSKHQGMFECSLSKKGEYSCNFGISTKEGKVYGAESC